MSRWHYHEALFVDCEYRRVITGVRAIRGPAEKTRWWQVGLLPAINQPVIKEVWP